MGHFVCPLCNGVANVWGGRDIYSPSGIAEHVGHHLKSLAFFCLRNLDQGSDGQGPPAVLSVGRGPSRPRSPISLSAGTGPDFEEGAEPQQELSHKNMEYYEGLDSQEQELCHENADVGNWEFLKSVAADGYASPISAWSPRRRFAEVQHQEYRTTDPNSQEPQWSDTREGQRVGNLVLLSEEDENWVLPLPDVLQDREDTGDVEKIQETEMMQEEEKMRNEAEIQDNER